MELSELAKLLLLIAAMGAVMIFMISYLITQLMKEN